jgi:tetratricopeptide (TPR) repeat protein
MRRIFLLLPVILLACAGHEKRGDRAAAVGDWKAAERDYADSLRKDPGNAEKRAKYESARQRALQASLGTARACLVSQDFECAFAESEYAQRLEPADMEIAGLRAEAARNVGLLRLRRAAEASARRDHRAAFDLFGRGRDVSPDAAVQAEATRVAPSLVAGAVDDAQQYRAAQQYPQAIDLLALAAGIDGRVGPTLQTVRGEYDRWLDAQYEATAQEGDAFLRERRFAEAQARYEAALRFRKGGRAEPLARYARALGQGEQAIQTRDFPRATHAYEEAIRTGMDGSGFAAVELERVRIRPYAVRVRSVLVKPVRPDGAPWTGARSRGFDRVVGLLAAAAFDGGGARAALDVYDALPHENRPNLVATLTLPDGRRFATEPRTALRARLESTVVVDTNHYDDRPITIHLSHAGGADGAEVGAVSFRIMDLLASRELSLRDRSIVELRVLGEPSPLRDGAAQGFAPLAPPPAIVPAVAPAAPAPAPAPHPRR